MYILVWDPTDETDERAIASNEFEEACIAILKMRVLDTRRCICKIFPKCSSL